MKTIFYLCAAVLATAFFVASADAWSVKGSVRCPAGDVGYPNVNITITGQTCAGPFKKTVTTDSAGNYRLGLPNCAGTFKACIDITTLPPDAVLCSEACVEFATDANNQNVDVNFCADSSLCHGNCPSCVDPALGLGAAAGCTVLELGSGKVSITGPAGGIFGDICIGPNSSLSMSGDEYVTGLIKLAPGVTFSNSSHGTVNVVQNVDLSAQISAAYAAASSAAGMSCTQSFTTLNGTNVTTITGVAGTNVICVQDITLSGKQILLTGPAGAKFIFNVTGKFVLTGGGAGPQIRVDGVNVLPKDVLYNIIGTGPDVAFSGGGGGVNCCAAKVDGTLLAPSRKIALSPGLVNGEIISSKDISIVSGSSVRCPPCPQ
jgi:hypothetical protein